MIPYDDLVAALASWRARQGLPVVQAAGAAAAAAAPGRPPGPPPGPRTAPPGAPPRPAAPAPSDDFGADALIEAAYDPAGEDYVMSLGEGVIVESAESTAIGGPPEAVAEGVLMPKRGKRKQDW